MPANSSPPSNGPLFEVILGPFEGKELFQEDVGFKVRRLQSSKKRNLSNQKLANPVAEIVVHICSSSSTYPWS